MRMNNFRRPTYVGAFLVAVITSWWSTGSASAQLGADRIQRPINTPSFSPYLNLFRNGENSGPVLNYYGLVKPQFQAIQQGQQFGQNIQALQFQQQQQQQMMLHGGRQTMMPYNGYSQLSITGHPVVFQSYSNGQGGGNFGGGGFGGAGGGGFGAGGFGNANFGGGTFGGGNFGGGMTGGGFGGGNFGGGMTGGGFTGGMSGHPVMFGMYNQN